MKDLRNKGLGVHGRNRRRKREGGIRDWMGWTAWLKGLVIRLGKEVERGEGLGRARNCMVKGTEELGKGIGWKGRRWEGKISCI